MAQFVVKVELDKEQFQSMIDDFRAENPDFVEVVRCRDCYHRIEQDGFCTVIGGFCEDEEWFCACGERRAE